MHGRDDVEVKGEWIETTDKPDYEISYVENTLVVTCKVKGKAREIVTAQIDFRAHVLRNGTDDKFVVLITTDDGATWTTLGLWDYEGTTGRNYYDIPCYPTEVNFNLSAFIPTWW